MAWSDKELLFLVQFLMLFTDGKTWVAHKEKKFWDDAGSFIHQQSHTCHCCTGKLDMKFSLPSAAENHYLGKSSLLSSDVPLSTVQHHQYHQYSVHL